MDLELWIVLVVGIVEVVARVVPDEKVKGILGYVVDLLKFGSDYLNRGKKVINRNKYT